MKQSTAVPVYTSDTVVYPLATVISSEEYRLHKLIVNAFHLTLCHPKFALDVKVRTKYI